MMKKIMTTTLLIAAGTTLSNAAFALSDAVLGWGSFASSTPEINKCSASVTLNGATISDGKLTTSASSAVKLTATDSFSTMVDNRATFTAIMTLDISSLLGRSANTAIFTISTGGNSSDLGFGVDTSGKLVGYWGNGTHSSFNVQASVWNTNNYVKDGKLTIAFKQLADDAGTRIALVNQGTDNVDYWTNSGLRAYDKENVTTICLGGDQTAGTNTGAITFEQFYLFNSALSESDIEAAVVAMQSVPEPSAFGLLAGLGALALVASRRRCSRK